MVAKIGSSLKELLGNVREVAVTFLVVFERVPWQRMVAGAEAHEAAKVYYSCQFTLQCGTSMPLIFKEKAETEMYALGIPIETAGRVLGTQYETHRPVDRPVHKATLR